MRSQAACTADNVIPALPGALANWQATFSQKRRVLIVIMELQD